ncbi:MAG: hypothetical protein JKY34_11290 [Kordiimonadaceae bacterium]|nr:hypothetical protein [Kordiimonadaceae bacterium]
MTFDREKWIENAKYLPPVMSDFHDCKDVFKTMVPNLANYRKSNPNIPDVSWVDMHCLTVDVFLFFMAMHGYKLQRMPKEQREKLKCLDLERSVNEHKDALMGLMTADITAGLTNKHRKEPEHAAD